MCCFVVGEDGILIYIHSVLLSFFWLLKEVRNEGNWELWTFLSLDSSFFMRCFVVGEDGILMYIRLVL